MRKTLPTNIIDNFASTYNSGRLFRLGAFTITELTKAMKGYKVVKEFEITGRIGCHYENVAHIAPTAPTTPTKAPNYAYECNKRIKRFFSTGNRQLVFYPMPKNANVKSKFTLIDPNGNETPISTNTAIQYGVQVGAKPITMLVNTAQIFRLNKTIAK